MIIWAWLKALMRRNVCLHNWDILKCTYAPPLKWTAMDLVFLDHGVSRDYAVHGCTGLLLTCKRCGAAHAVTLLGQAVATEQAKLRLLPGVGPFKPSA